MCILAVFPLLFLVACSSSSLGPSQTVDYCYEAKSENYHYIITPTTLEITRTDGLWCGEKLIVSGGNMEYCEITEPLSPDASVLKVSELFYKIFMGQIDTETERNGDHLKVTGIWSRPFTLMLDKKTLEPYSLYWMGENIMFE
ncbi:MAG: hypothetical protein DBX47_00655 [Clostridiales bacterium]|nr:MAG: hypothetical protein DBX47_00655 [Clostridiales bacterium]